MSAKSIETEPYKFFLILSYLNLDMQIFKNLDCYEIGI